MASLRKAEPLIVASMVLATAPFIHALDLSDLAGTMEVQFQPMPSAGVVEGCTLVYRVIGQDYVYHKGQIVALVGTIAYFTTNQRNTIGLSLKIKLVDGLDGEAKARAEAPFFAYLQSPHGTTAKGTFRKHDAADHYAIFVFEFDEDAVKVFNDLIDRLPITIGFTRQKDGFDVLVPLDLSIAASTLNADGSVSRRRSDDMLDQFITCTSDVTEQVQRTLKAR